MVKWAGNNTTVTLESVVAKEMRAMSVPTNVMLGLLEQQSNEPSDEEYRAMALAMMPNREEIASAAIAPPQEWLEEEWN